MQTAMQVRAPFAAVNLFPIRRCSVKLPCSVYRTSTHVQRHPVHLRAENGPGSKLEEPQSQSPAGEEKLPPWIRSEKEREMQKQSTGLPWPLYLLLSCFTAIAAVGSIFEFANKHSIFSVIEPSNPLWAPILGFFALTGLPTAGFLFFKGVNAANEAAEKQDRIDGYLDD
eukprot:jgi/Chrzof1/8455/Cz03g11070.t1